MYHFHIVLNEHLFIGLFHPPFTCVCVCVYGLTYCILEMDIFYGHVLRIDFGFFEVILLICT